MRIFYIILLKSKSWRLFMANLAFETFGAETSPRRLTNPIVQATGIGAFRT